MLVDLFAITPHYFICFLDQQHPNSLIHLFLAQRLTQTQLLNSFYLDLIDYLCVYPYLTSLFYLLILVENIS